MAAGLNAWTLDFARATPGCLPSATLYPEPGVRDYVTAALDAGARIFKVHLQVGGFPPDDPQLRPVWGLLAEAGVPVVVHAGHAPVATAHTGPGPFTALGLAGKLPCGQAGCVPGFRRRPVMKASPYSTAITIRMKW